MPREAHILREHQLAIVVEIVPRRHCRRRRRQQVAARARGDTDVPALVRPVADPAAESRVVPVHLVHLPVLGPRRQRAVLDLRGVGPTAQLARDRGAGRVARAPDDRQAEPAVRELLPGKGLGPDVRPAQQRGRAAHRGDVPHAREVLVRERRGNEGIIPGAVPPDPVPHHRGELAHLEIEPAVLPGCDAQRVLVQPPLRAAVRRVEAAVEPALQEEIGARPELHVEERREPRIEERGARRDHQPGRRLLERVGLDVEGSAQARAHGARLRTHREMLVQPVEEIPLSPPGRRQHQQAPRKPRPALHAAPPAATGTTGAGCAALKRTSNSVHSASDRTSRRSP